MAAIPLAAKSRPTTIRLRIVRGVYVDRQQRKPGEIVEVSPAVAAELLMSTRAELVDAEHAALFQSNVTWNDAPPPDAPFKLLGTGRRW